MQWSGRREGVAEERGFVAVLISALIVVLHSEYWKIPIGCNEQKEAFCPLRIPAFKKRKFVVDVMTWTLDSDKK